MTHDQERERFEAWYLSHWKAFESMLDRDNNGEYLSPVARSQWIAWQAAKREPVVTAQMMKQAADAWCEWFGCDNDDSQRPSGTFFLHILTKALTTPRGG